jgi:leucyl aminopeptidase
MKGVDVAQFSFSAAAPTEVAADVLVLPVFEGPESGPGVAKAGLADAFKAAKLNGKKGESLLVMRHDGDAFAAKAVLLLGVGPKARISPDALRRAVGRVAPSLARFGSVATTLPQAVGRGGASEAIEATVEGIALGSYRFDRYRTKKPVDATVRASLSPSSYALTPATLNSTNCLSCSM